MTTIDIRFVNPDGTLGELLPEWETFEYQDVPDDVGVVSMTYPPDGVRADLIQANQEFAICLDGAELPNGRFRFDQAQGDPIRDTMGNLTWAGLTLLNRLAEATVIPLTDTAALQDVLTAEERKWYDEAVSAAKSQWQTDQADAMKEYREAFSKWKTSGKGLEPAKPEETTFDEQLEGLIDSRFSSAPAPVAPLFTKATPGKVMLDLFRSAQSRGAIQELTVGFTATQDSKGMTWPKTLTQRFDVGQSLLQVAQWLTENEYAEARMVGRRLDLYAYDDEANYTGTDRTAAGVMLAYGKNLVDGPRQQDYREMVNALYAVSDTGVHGWVTDPERIKRDGRIEGTYSGTGQKTWKELHDAAMQVINSYGDGKEERVYGLVGEDAVPYRDFGVGDSILVLEGEYPEPMVVKAITLSIDNAGAASWAVTLNDRILDDVERTALRLQSMIGNTAATMGGAGLLTYQTPGMFADGSAPVQPSAPQIVTGSGAAQFSYDGSDVNGDPALWDQDHVELHISTEPDFMPDATTLYDPYVYGSTTLPNLPYNTPLYAKFVAVDAGGDTSLGSEPVEFTVLPPVGATDGQPPSTAPTVEAIPGLGYIQLLWDQVTNADLTWYQVHCSTTQGFSYGPGTLVHVGPDSSFTLREYEAAPLVYGTTYYFRVVPQDEDDVGPQSSEVSATPMQVTSPDIAANQVWAGQAYIDQLIGGTLREDLVVGSKITTRPGDTGSGVELGLEGLTVYGPDGAPAVILPSDLAPGNPAVFKGDVEAETLIAKALTLRGSSNEFEMGSSTTIASGVTAPTQPPAVTAEWGTVTLAVDTNTYGSLRGIWWRSDISRWEVATAGTNDRGPARLHRLYADGSLDTVVTQTLGPSGNAVWRLHSAVISSTRYWWVWVKPDNDSPRLSQWTWTGSAFAQDWSVEYVRMDDTHWGGISDDGTYVCILDADYGNNRWRIDKRSLASGAHVSYSYLSWGDFEMGVVHGIYGTFGSNFGGAARWLISGHANYVVPHSGSGTPAWSEVFPRAQFGWTVWDGTNFWGLHNLSPVLYKYENGNLLSDASGTTQDWWTGYTWQDTIGTTHETDCVNAAKFSMSRRKRVRVNMPTLPPGSGGADDVNAVGVYLGKGATKPARTSLWLQSVSATELVANGNFETNVDGWGSNPAFGAFVPATVSRSGTRAHLGSYSMLVTTPALSEGQRTWADQGAEQFVAGRQYRMRAWVYIPSSNPTNFGLQWDVVFFGTQPTAVTTKDTWVELDWTYTDPGGNQGKFPGIRTTAADAGGWASGLTYYVDDVRITPVDTAQPVYITDGAFSGTNPPASNGFGTSTPAAVESANTDSDGAIFHVHGDGSGRWGPFTFSSGGALTSGAVDQVVAKGTRTNADTSITAETLEFVTGSFAAEAGAVYKVEVNVPVANNTAGNYTRVRARIDTSASGITGTEVAECVVDNRVAGRREGAHIIGYWTQGSDQTLYGKVTVWPNANTTTCSFDLSPGFIVITKIG